MSFPWRKNNTNLTRTSTTRYFPATAAHHRGVTVCTDLNKKLNIQMLGILKQKVMYRILTLCSL
jgi:hypothetical protein